MDFEWDREKARENLKKHGVDFADAALVLEDEFALTLEDWASESEERFITLGRRPVGDLLVVVYTWRGESVRIISARRATRRESRKYEEGR